MERRIVIKFGGNALSEESDLHCFADDVHKLSQSGFSPIIVHGGGPEISAEMEKRGMTPTKVSGLRVTDLEGLQVAEEVLRKINSHIADVFKAAGCSVSGMSAESIITAVKKKPIEADGRLVDLGYVGDVDSFSAAPLNSLISDRIIPVIYPICSDASGGRLNVNADTAASGIARAAGASEMVLVTDVPGILKNGERIHSLTLSDADKLIETGVITGGMLPKVEACRTALLSGIHTVYMLNGKEKHALTDRLVNNADCGTSITTG